MRGASPSAADTATPVVDREEKRLVDACLGGDASARRRFLAELLPLIYRFDAGGHEHESASEDFLAFLFDGDRLFRRLRGYRGEAPLRAYLWHCILPDLMKQFRARLRRQRLDTVSIDDRPAAGATADRDAVTASSDADVAAALAALPIDKRVLIKLLHLEDFDLGAEERHFLAELNGWTLRAVAARLAEAREVIRVREAARHARLEAAASAGQWIRIYAGQLRQVEDDLAALGEDPARSERLVARRAELRRKLAKRERQRVEQLRAAEATLVTLPTGLIAELLRLGESTTRVKITRVRDELVTRLRAAPLGDGE